MSVRKVFAAIKYAEKTFERLSEVVSEEDQDGIAGALMKLTFAKEELEKIIPAAPAPAEHQGVQPTRNSEVLASFVRYCQENPEHRFWQALRNWSGYPFITVSDFSGESRDTFYWEGKRHDGK